MSVSGISSSSFFNAQSANVQNQQQWQQEFQKLGQELQAGSSSPQATAQTTAQTQLAPLQTGSQTSSTPALSSASSTQGFTPPQGTPKYGIHPHTPHHLRVSAGNDGDQDSDQLGETQQTANSSTAQQAYSAWQQDLQQGALNSDLLTAQSATWQPVSVSA